MWDVVTRDYSPRLTPDEVFADYLTPYIDETTGNFAIYVSNMSYVRADGTSESTFRAAYRQIRRHGQGR